MYILDRIFQPLMYGAFGIITIFLIAVGGAWFAIKVYEYRLGQWSFREALTPILKESIPIIVIAVACFVIWLFGMIVMDIFGINVEENQPEPVYIIDESGGLRPREMVNK